MRYFEKQALSLTKEIGAYYNALTKAFRGKRSMEKTLTQGANMVKMDNRLANSIGKTIPMPIQNKVDAAAKAKTKDSIFKRLLSGQIGYIFK